MDLRQRIVDAWRAGENKQSVSSRFLVGYATVKRYVRQVQQGGPLAPKPHGGGMPRTVDASGEALLRQPLHERPDLTDAELTERYRERMAGVPKG
jgi:transposase